MKKSLILALSVAGLLLSFLVVTAASSKSTPGVSPAWQVEAVPLENDSPIPLGQISSIVALEDDLLVSNTDGITFLMERPAAGATLWHTSIYLDVTAKVRVDVEEGFYSVALSPNFTTTHNLYVSYVNYAEDTVIERYNVVTQVATTVLTIPHAPRSDIHFHRAGHLEFLDGLLYISVGDNSMWFPFEPNHPAQRKDTLWGKILRIDVETGNPLTYTIPADNPYVSLPNHRPEIWLYGLRNPWKFAFDPATDDMYISDVGNGLREEVDYVPAGENDINFGWRCYEGSTVFPYDDPACDGVTNTLPIQEYQHGTFNDRVQCAVTGGRVYHDTGSPNLQGLFLYADYCASRIWGVKNSGGVWMNYWLLDLPEDFIPTAFGDDSQSHMYVGGSNVISRIIDTSPPGSTPVPTATPANYLFLPVLRR